LERGVVGELNKIIFFQVLDELDETEREKCYFSTASRSLLTQDG